MVETFVPYVVCSTVSLLIFLYFIITNAIFSPYRHKPVRNKRWVFSKEDVSDDEGSPETIYFTKSLQAYVEAIPKFKRRPHTEPHNQYKNWVECSMYEGKVEESRQTALLPVNTIVEKLQASHSRSTHWQVRILEGDWKDKVGWVSFLTPDGLPNFIRTKRSEKVDTEDAEFALPVFDAVDSNVGGEVIEEVLIFDGEWETLDGTILTVEGTAVDGVPDTLQLAGSPSADIEYVCKSENRTERYTGVFSKNKKQIIWDDYDRWTLVQKFSSNAGGGNLGASDLFTAKYEKYPRRAMKYKVVGFKGVVIREEKELESEIVHEMPCGQILKVREKRDNRVKVIFPVIGWASIRNREGYLLLAEEGPKPWTRRISKRRSALRLGVEYPE